MEIEVNENNIELGKLFIMTLNKHNLDSFDKFKLLIIKIFDDVKNEIINHNYNMLTFSTKLSNELKLLPSESILVFSKLDEEKLLSNIKYLLIQEYPEFLT